MLFATYAVVGRNYAAGPSPADLFDLPLVAINTAMLLLSSITYGFAMLQMERKAKAETLFWLGVTGVFGAIFLGLELYEFNHLIHEGAGPQRSAFLSAFFTLVGTHGLHVTFGIIWLITLMVQPPMEKPVKRHLALRAFLLFAALVFATLGAWQVQRLFWKLDLISRVDARIHAAPVAVPQPPDWAAAAPADFEYRHVQLSGLFDHTKETLVQAVTERGPGFWVLTPLTGRDGTSVLINRGFVPPQKRDPASRAAGQVNGEVTVAGLLRLSEPSGAFLRHNQPDSNLWYSRDVEAIATAKGLRQTAPFFVDADGQANPGGLPIGGMTVVRFSNSHLVYAATWFGLTILSLAGVVMVWILMVVAVSMIPYFLAFDLPKRIINGPIQGEGFEDLTATQPFLNFSFRIPFVDLSFGFDGYPLDRVQTLVALSGVFLLLVIINGGFKYYINTYKGRLGERLLRRIRFELVDRVLRFPPRHVKSLNGAEIASMVKDEVEPFGGFTGDAFVQPALLGGQALAALFFIILQNFWLGMVAAFMVAIQIIIIPKMRRRLIELGRQRQITARRLAGKVNEVVEGLGTIHAFDTSNYERADVASRLGEIFRIRYDLYQWKFLVKFLNNFLSQLTPFLFYLIGGYLTLRGTLDVGQLVAVINAYKDLPGPLKELIDWDQARQDVQVKYEQVVENFEIEDLIHPSVHALTRQPSHPRGEILQAVAVSVNDDSGAKVVDHVSLKVEHGDTVALIDHGGRGAEAIAEALGRLVWPSSGKICLGDADIRELPEAVTGRHISYVSSDSYFFHGSLKDNLLYGLKHAPVQKNQYAGKEARQRLWEIREAKKAGNPHLDIKAGWVDYSSAALGNGAKEDLKKSLMAALDAVQLTDDILELALHSTIDPAEDPDFAARVVDMRHALRDRMEELGMDSLVIPFEPYAYNGEATIAENLLFGATLEPLTPENELLSSEHFYAALRKVGLQRVFVDIGRTVAKNLVEIFGGLPADHPFFRQVTSLSAEDISYYQTLLQRRADPKPSNFRLSDADKAFIRLTLEYIEPRYRLGILNAELQDKIVGARELFYTELPHHLRDLIERYDPDRYVSVATLRENIVFGKLSNRNADGVAELRSLAASVSAELGFRDQLVKAGLEYDIGSGGRRLTPVQRRKLNLARALIRRSDYYIFNKPLPGLERHAQEEIVSERGPNSIVGDISILCDGPRTATVQAATAVEALKINKDYLFRIMDDCPGMTMKVTRALAERLRLTSSELDKVRALQKA
eukprot:g25363.t1